MDPFGEAVLFADLDIVGHYARPDAFRLNVDTRPKAVVGAGGLGGLASR